jgi:hypothetical protein
LLLFIRACPAHDVFIFTFGTTFCDFLELPLLRLLGKKTVFVFNGSDHRPPYMNGVYMSSADDENIARVIAETRLIKRRLRRIEAHAHVIIGHHLSAHLHERPFVPALLLGLPFAAPVGVSQSEATSDGRPVRIVHAPSRPEVKGTVKIRAAVEALRGKGYAIDLVEIVGKPNAVVLDELSRCDFVVDELYSDTRMAGLATEAAFFGKPAVVGGYASDDELMIEGVYPPEQFPPVEFCHPDLIQEAIERLVADERYRVELGARAREFVLGPWAPAAVASRYLRLMAERPPDGWLYDPGQIGYLLGAGMSASVARIGMHRVIETHGVQALCLSDKPELEQAVVRFAESADAEATVSSEVAR